MKLLFKGFSIFAGIIACLWIGFSLYAHFLMDYSLENLTLAITGTQKNLLRENGSPMVQKIYEDLVQDLTVEEVASENLDQQSLLLLDLANRSLKEGEERAGFGRAKYYLTEVAEIKKPVRSAFLYAFDSLTKKVLVFFQSSAAFIYYSVNRIAGGKQADQEDISDYASALLLNRAQAKEREGFPEEAAAYYRKYLKIYESRPERGLAKLSLSNLLIKQKKYDEAEEILKGMQLGFRGSEESHLAEKLLRKIGSLKVKQQLINQLKRQLTGVKKSDKDPILLRLGLAYLYTYQLNEALLVFEKLEQSQNPEMAQKATFYKGWVYKLNQDYDKSIQAFSLLLEDEGLQRDFEFGLRAQLADLFHKKGDVRRSLNQYQVISRKAKEEVPDNLKATHSVWKSFSELEQVNIYYFDLEDTRSAQDLLKSIADLEGSDYQVLEIKLNQAAKINLRDLAFQALIEKKIDQALDLFLKYLEKHREDPLTLTGLATVYALMGDLETAKEYAKKSYEIQANEYATLTYAYVLGLQNDFENSIKKYLQVMAQNPNSIPARFNLAYDYLQIKKYREAVELLLPLDAELEVNTERKFLRSKTLNNIGYAYWGLDNLNEAAAKFEKALAVTPEFKTAKKNLAMIGTGQIPQPVKIND